MKFFKRIEVEIMFENLKMELSTICTVCYYFLIVSWNMLGIASTEGYKQGKKSIYIILIFFVIWI